MIWRALILFVLPFSALAQVEITEIMYAPEAGATHEWFEIYNNGGGDVNLKDWRFNDGSNHVFEEPPKNGGQGSLVISVGAFAIIAKEADTFLSDHLGFSGTVIDASFSLTDTGKSISLINGDGFVVDTASYGENAGAQKNGLSLQKVNNVWIAAAPTPGVPNSFAPLSGQSSQSGGGEENTQTSSGSTSAGSNSFLPIESKIKTSISGPANGFAGVEIYLNALTLGLQGEPIPNARHLWSFGDGAMAEGRSVVHTYSFPGEYTVALEASSDEYGASGRHKVKILEPQVAFKKVVAGAGGFVELANGSVAELDLSYWQIRSGGFYFAFPKNTVIAAKSSAIFPSSVIGLELVPGDTHLLYPNGFVAVKDELPVVAMAVLVPESRKEDVVSAPPVRSVTEDAVTPEGKVENFVFDPVSSAIGELSATSALAATVIPFGADKSDSNLIWYAVLFLIAGTAFAGYVLLVKNNGGQNQTGTIEISVRGQTYTVTEEGKSEF